VVLDAKVESHPSTVQIARLGWWIAPPLHDRSHVPGNFLPLLLPAYTMLIVEQEDERVVQAGGPAS
jgi:hypothetical protein